MLRFASLLVFGFTALLIGCQGEPSTSPTPGTQKPAIKPFLVKTHKGIDHEFYRDVSLDEFFKTLPTGSVDSVELIADKGSPVFALVKVPEQADKDLDKIHFETVFTIQNGQSIEKRWSAAKGRKSGKAVAVFCLPAEVIGGETRIVSNSD
jgi:hypothetical protein